MQGKKVRENPLLDYLGQSNDDPNQNAAAGASGAFGSQQQFQLKAYYGEAARGDDEDDEDKKDLPKKVSTVLMINVVFLERRACRVHELHWRV